MRPNIHLNKHPHGYIWGNTYLSINQRKSAIISQIYRWHIFYMDRLWKRTTTLSIINQQGTPSIKFDFNYSKTQIHFLDITIAKTSTGIVSTTLYRKEITWKSYANQKSEHPET